MNSEVIEEFLQDFPTVNKEQPIKVLSLASKLLSTQKVVEKYENLVG